VDSRHAAAAGAYLVGAEATGEGGISTPDRSAGTHAAHLVDLGMHARKEDILVLLRCYAILEWLQVFFEELVVDTVRSSSRSSSCPARARGTVFEGAAPLENGGREQ